METSDGLISFCIEFDLLVVISRITKACNKIRVNKFIKKKNKWIGLKFTTIQI